MLKERLVSAFSKVRHSGPMPVIAVTSCLAGLVGMYATMMGQDVGGIDSVPFSNACFTVMGFTLALAADDKSGKIVFTVVGGVNAAALALALI
jgi:hypothetical protein